MSERLNNADRLNGDAVDLGRFHTIEEYDNAFKQWNTRNKYTALIFSSPERVLI